VHELSLAEAILQIVEEHAAGRRVKSVQLKVGHLRQVVPSALTFSFELLAQGTVAEGAALEIEDVVPVGVCRRCGARSELPAFPLQCRACEGFDLEIVAGEELLVESLELEEGEDAGASSHEDGSREGSPGRE
jgi:hydrogenase nickel incorporation protein HypA/HybF